MPIDPLGKEVTRHRYNHIGIEKDSPPSSNTKGRKSDTPPNENYVKNVKQNENQNDPPMILRGKVEVEGLKTYWNDDHLSFEKESHLKKKPGKKGRSDKGRQEKCETSWSRDESSQEKNSQEKREKSRRRDETSQEKNSQEKSRSRDENRKKKGDNSKRRGKNGSKKKANDCLGNKGSIIDDKKLNMTSVTSARMDRGDESRQIPIVGDARMETMREGKDDKINGAPCHVAANKPHYYQQQDDSWEEVPCSWCCRYLPDTLVFATTHAYRLDRADKKDKELMDMKQ